MKTTKADFPTWLREWEVLPWCSDFDQALANLAAEQHEALVNVSRCLQWQDTVGGETCLEMPETMQKVGGLCKRCKALRAAEQFQEKYGS